MGNDQCDWFLCETLSYVWVGIPGASRALCIVSPGVWQDVWERCFPSHIGLHRTVFLMTLIFMVWVSAVILSQLWIWWWGGSAPCSPGGLRRWLHRAITFLVMLLHSMWINLVGTILVLGSVCTLSLIHHQWLFCKSRMGFAVAHRGLERSCCTLTSYLRRDFPQVRKICTPTLTILNAGFEINNMEASNWTNKGKVCLLIWTTSLIAEESGLNCR